MRRARHATVGIAVLLGVLGLWLAFDNPNVGAWSRGQSYQCLAPWDTVLNDASNVPGGDLESDSEEVAARCRDAGRQRFALAGGSALGSVVIGVLAATRRRSPAVR